MIVRLEKDTKVKTNTAVETMADREKRPGH